MENWQERTEMLLGAEGVRKLRDAHVAVIGVGGVGGFAAEALARAGVGHLLALDSDEVSVTNRNRQILALSSTVGHPKCDVLRDRLLDINPDLDLVTIPEYITEENIASTSMPYRRARTDSSERKNT